MKSAPLAGIGSLGYALGDLYPIEALEVLREKPELLASLKTKGVSRFAQATDTPVELAYRAARETLDSSGVEAADVEAIVYASTSFWEKQFYSERDIAWLMNQLGLVNAYPVGVFLPGCANATSSMRVAINMIRAEGYRNVMVVTTDKVIPGDSIKRVMWPDVSVLSDAAASFMVTSTGQTEFDVIAISHHSAPFMWDLDNQNNVAAFLMSTVKGAQQTVADVLQRANLTTSGIRTLLTNNYNNAVMQMIARKCGFDENQVYLRNVSRFAHGYAADTLVNLKDDVAGRPANRGDLFMLLGTGHKNWGAVVLCKT
jgi:3-oxoacyl-[acyl-carrier-protein] synthase III